MATIFETVQEGETHKFWVDLTNEAPFDLMKIYWKVKATGKTIAKLAYPATAGYITLTKTNDRYTAVIPAKTSVGLTGATVAEFHFLRGSDLDIKPKTDFPVIERTLSPLSD